MILRYNAPVSLTLSWVSVVVLILGGFTGGQTTALLFSVHGTMGLLDPFAWLRLFLHVLGHGNWEHVLGNLSFILLLGPILEEKYGSGNILIMIAITALITGLLNVIFFNTSLLGASGIVFMFILLSSFTNIRSGEIPLTFILVVGIYLTREVVASFRDDNISQFAHIIGGTTGSIFGFILGSKQRSA